MYDVCIHHTHMYGQWAIHVPKMVWAVQVLERLSRPGCEHYATLRFTYWLQWHLHRQLRDASAYAAEHRVALKGDLPIGTA